MVEVEPVVTAEASLTPEPHSPHRGRPEAMPALRTRRAHAVVGARVRQRQRMRLFLCSVCKASPRCVQHMS